MPDLLVSALATDGLIWLVIAVCVAGVVRGFAGFGSAMIIMPVASSVLAPVEAVIFLICAELVGPLPNAAAAWRDGAPRDVGLLLAGAILAMPLGVWSLSAIDSVVFGWTVSVAVVVLSILTISGWRLKQVLTAKLTVLTGAVGGFMTGFAGIPGPPVIMLYMASRLPAAVIRANFLLYLLAIDLLLFPLLWMMGLMNWPIAFLGVLVGIPNLIANMIGARLFDPSAERIFRAVAYLVIAASAIIGLPIWKG
ncbi:sulfite exporter TauE/SafE family protein [Sulfitobacter sp. F26169L]|uniref:sulfite exporter TauE/SafE family protein n=1 Tax=Sulfitobacter sp. F26169L TaxID=2996015 RepID=UPI002260A6B8|nr:sulfite exporter TauE/SafE family protein [Sulfitobacter sp. F26169L]MCX7565044.1 sulfite exporter TauE/SafE family protein [Sulfitobacter sp. F26169L]